ncbi:MAG: kynureninase [Methanobacteriota archaeon]|nr:MAG: kynureninase [Euryarchaeota archaeon]
MHYEISEEFPKKMDENDELKPYKEKFYHPITENGEPAIYFCGNSLGLQPKDVPQLVQRELDSWARNGVEGHFHDTTWTTIHEKIAEMSAPIVGAKKEEVTIMNTLTVNLHLMLVSFYRPTSKRYKILIERNAFPSDIYAIKSQIRFHGFDPKETLEIVGETDEEIDTATVLRRIEELGDELALILIGGINYYSGQIFDMEQITKKGHEVGAIVGFDLAHAFANIPLNLHEWEVDFAVWCNYKYGNGGPGAIAGAFVHEKHFEENLPRFEGWWGNKKETRFLMREEMETAYGAEAWQISNVPILSLVPLKSSIGMIKEIGMEKLRRKSVTLTGYLVFLLDKIDDDRIYITPRDPNQRGCQVSIHIKERGKELFKAITKRGIICDWREPDVIRVAPVPLYNSYQEVFRFYNIFRQELENL